MVQDSVIIVESPGKCAKIEKLSGMKCIASYGHIMDIPSNIQWFKDEYNKDNTINPPYSVIPSKQKIVKNIQKVCRGKRVIVASDLDREGEAIAENIMRVLSLNPDTTERIRFNKITHEAIQSALNTSGRLDVHLYNAQQARRLVDILFGFMLSPILWKYIQNGLSAGRCQSPTLGILLERQKEQKLDTKFYKGIATCLYKRNNVHIQRKDNIVCHDPIHVWLKNMISQEKFILENTKKSDKKQEPAPPCITSTLQQEAYRRFKIHPNQCMKHAQKLYEAGYITYMRTDSTELSIEFQNECFQFIKNTYGENFVGKPRTSAPKRAQKPQTTQGPSKGPPKAQEAHEAIRPSHIQNIPGNGFTAQEKKIFTIVWERAVASLMAAYHYNEITLNFVPILMKKSSEIWYASQSKETFPGFKILCSPYETFQKDQKDQNKTKLNDEENNTCNKNNYTVLETIYNEYEKSENLSNHQQFPMNSFDIKDCFEKPKAPYTPSELIKVLEKSVIGRPSTFGTIIEKIQDKKYVQISDCPSLDQNMDIYTWKRQTSDIKLSKYVQKIGGQKNVFVVTPLGIKITEFLNDACASLVKSSFTSDLESALDDVANGTLCWKQVVGDFYTTLHTMISDFHKCQTLTSKYLQYKTENKDDTSESWVIRFDKKWNTHDIGIVTKYNTHMIGVYDTHEQKYIKYTPLPPKAHEKNISYEEACFMCELPKEVQLKGNKTAILHYGRYGWYATMNEKNIHLKTLSSRRMPPNQHELEEIIAHTSKNEKIQVIQGIKNEWSIWYNPTKKSFFLMKRTKNHKNGKNTKTSKSTFFTLQNYSKDTNYTEKLCEEIASASRN